jgi:polyisoprenoid-binding protein YceI
MKNLKIALMLLVLSTMSFAQTSWSVDKSHSKIGFTVDHLVISEVDGKFDTYEVSILSDNDEFENAAIEFSADVASVDTDNEKRDNHLKSDDFFNAEKFPKMTFVGKSFKKVEGKNYKLVGDLTIRDVTKEVVLDVKYNGTVTDPWGNTKAGFKATTTINRFDYGLKFDAAMETGGLVVGDEVEIEVALELAKQK